ncbi:MAG: CYTH and CHAD domain-containing protein [Actinomycetota bacterium]|nr:CYTH and CHAD domain-containing protein [Actinomycetota bacterium]
MPTRFLETERTYDPPEGATLPDLVAATDGLVAAVEHLDEIDLDATYVDTDDLALLRRRVTLRHRKGGADSGWHLKLPLGRDTRHEVHWPLTSSGTRVPRTVQDTLSAYTLGEPLRPVVRLQTTRRRCLLRADDGSALAELCDDQVAATVLVGAPFEQGTTRWREIEVELLEGRPELLATVDDAMAAVGAMPAPTQSKLVRAMADRLPEAVELTNLRCSAGDSVTRYLREQVEQLRAADLDLRLDEDGEGVHDVRVQARRLRAAVAVYRSVLDQSVARLVQAELRELGQALGPVRDLQVTREQLRDAVGDLDPAAAATVAGLAGRTLAERDEQTRATMRRALTSRRYVGLLRDLDALGSAGGGGMAAEPAGEVLPRQVRKASKRLRRRARTATDVPAGRRTEALHDVRKAAKRLRYACEVAEPAVGKPARRLGKAARRVQRTLGDHHDAVALAALLEELAAADTATGPAGFVLGRLHGAQVVRATTSERDYQRALKRVTRAKATRWLR